MKARTGHVQNVKIIIMMTETMNISNTDTVLIMSNKLSINILIVRKKRDELYLYFL